MNSRSVLLAVVAVVCSVRSAFPQGGAPQPSTAPTTSTVAAKKAVQEAQHQLRVLGYDPGPADGSVGSKTVLALKKFQSDLGLDVTGVLDKKTLSALSAGNVPKSVPAPRGDPATALAHILDNVGAQGEYQALNLPAIVRAFDQNHDIDALAPLERQAVLDVLLQRLYVTRKAPYKFPGVQVSEAGADYLHEGRSGLSMSGTSKGQTRDGRTYEFVLVGAVVDADHHIMSIGTGQTAVGAGEIAKSALRGAKGSLAIISAGDGIWLVSTRMPRDRIAMGPTGMGMGDVVFPIGDGTIYGFSGEIKGFLPGITIATHEDKTVYFALVAGLGMVYLAGEATVSSDNQPGTKTTLPLP